VVRWTQVVCSVRMWHTEENWTENPPRTDLFGRRRTLAYVKEARMETSNPDHNKKPFFRIHA